MNFHNLLGERVRRLIEDEKREVIVVGDINICSAPIDHCEGNMSGNREAFYDPPAREWFKNWIDPEFGPMVDVVRQCWPERKGMYTCARDEIYSLSQNCLIVFQAGIPKSPHARQITAQGSITFFSPVAYFRGSSMATLCRPCAALTIALCTLICTKK